MKGDTPFQGLPDNDILDVGISLHAVSNLTEGFLSVTSLSRPSGYTSDEGTPGVTGR